MHHETPGPAARRLADRHTFRRDAAAGLVLGVHSVPDGLATGLLAGVNPLAGLYGYLIGTLSGALSTGATFMAVQGTGAMAMLVADVDALRESDNPARALVTLSLMTGAAMILAGLLRLGGALRFVSNAVMVGFVNAIGVSIVLGQLANLTGYSAEGANRVIRAADTVVHADRVDGYTLAVGIVTIALIVLLERTPLRSLGLVAAVILTSVGVAVLGWDQVATLDDLGVAIGGLPTLELPSAKMVPVLVVPALSLAFVGLVQGAGISANYPNPDGTYADASRDFLGQGVANVASGLGGGMPVGGSMSASALNKQAGARSRWSLVIASLVMAIVIVVFGGVVGHAAMPALAGLLMLVGFRTVKPAAMRSVWHTGLMQKAVMAGTFVLTMVIPLQYAVLAGVGMSVALHVVRQSNHVSIRRQVRSDDGHLVERDPPATVPPNDVVVLQPYGSLFFAAAPVFEAALPEVTPASRGSVIILRLRGRDDLGTTFMDVLARYAGSLTAAGSKLVIVSVSDRIVEHLHAVGVTDIVGEENIYPGDERVGATLESAWDDALAWVEQHR